MLTMYDPPGRQIFRSQSKISIMGKRNTVHTMCRVLDVCFRLTLYSMYYSINQKVLIILISFANNVHIVMLSVSSAVATTSLLPTTYVFNSVFSLVCVILSWFGWGDGGRCPMVH